MDFLLAHDIHADLRRANLSSVQLVNAQLMRADLRRANLRGANLTGALLSAANLEGANLSNADLQGAILNFATLRDANLDRATLAGTVFGNVDLHDVIGLDSCVHAAPSIVDHRTLMRSGHLPLPFIRGCGLPDGLIDYLPALVAAGPIQFYSCFISYSTEDQDFANRLHPDLQNKGVRCWFAPHDIQGGKKIHEQIDEAIRVYDKLLLILSPASMASEWVKSEIANARHKEVNEQRQVLFPISVVPFEKIKAWKNFDADTGKDSAREIREYFIPDFSRWKTDHDAYAQAFNRLVKDLRTEKEVGV
jgi:hypothetical protein